MLRKFDLENKPLSLANSGDTFYFGDSRGGLYKVDYPFNNITKVFDVGSPVSSIVIHQNRFFYSTWDGEVGETNFTKNKKTQLIRSIIKCMTIFKDHLFVSVDHIIYILSLDLIILDKFEVPHKVLCFYATEDKVYAGMSVPFLGEIKKENEKFRFEILRKTEHDTSILAICDNVTGSSDGRLIQIDKQSIIFASTGWIRSIFSIDLFSCGTKVIERSSEGVFKVLYEHEDDVMEVIKIKDKIISIGLDYKVCIWEGLSLSKDELREIEELNSLF